MLQSLIHLIGIVSFLVDAKLPLATTTFFLIPVKRHSLLRLATMHCQFFLRSVSALSLVAAAFSLPSPLARPAPADSSAILKPINIKDFENALGIQRRASDDFSDLDLQTQTQLIYGRPGSEPTDPFCIRWNLLTVSSQRSIHTCEYDPVRA